MEYKKEASLRPKGVCTARLECKTTNGLYVPLSAAISDETYELLEERGYKRPEKEIRQGNLVVNAGREVLAQSLGGYWETQSLVTPYINRITLGDGTKSGNLPNLSDTGLVNEIQKLNGTTAGTFLLNGPNDVSPDITFPPSVQRYPGSGFGGSGTVTINSSGETLLSDSGVDYINTIGVQLTDQVTLNNSSTNPLVLGVREVRSSTVLVLHNPSGFTGGPLQYKIGTPGTQMLVSKLIEGNQFLKADYGAAVLVHEAGLLFHNDTLFNRVVFAPNDEEVGVLLQSDETNGVEISVRFEWLITL